MKRSEIRVLLMRAPGTNCDAETARSFRDLGVQAEVIHTQKVFKERNLLEYDILVFPGGFSYGDYIRSAAIWAKECEYRIGPDLEKFVEEERPVLGICNGFQLLVEAGFLPGFEGRSIFPEAALANNTTGGYQCRWVRIKHLNKGNCRLTREIPLDTVLRLPVSHGEGRFLFPRDKEADYLQKLYDSDQLVFRFVKPDGSFAGGEAFYNPNGAFHDIAGICNQAGNVLGLMPHPERAYYGWLTPYWTKEKTPPDYGDGRLLFESVINLVEKKF
jgi:phosphoribosylformylglycinamidine synthase